MNWKRGFFRLWIVGSIVWIAATTLVLRPYDILLRSEPDEIQISFADGGVQIAFPASTDESTVRNALSQFLNNKPELTSDQRKWPKGQLPRADVLLLSEAERGAMYVDEAIVEFRRKFFERIESKIRREDALRIDLPLIFLPPIVVFVLGAALMWAIGGFRK